MDLFNVLQFAKISLMAFSVIAYLVFVKRQTIEYRLFTAYLFVVLLLNAESVFMNNNMHLYASYWMIIIESLLMAETLLINLFYLKLVKNQKQKRLVLSSLSIALSVMLIVMFTYTDDIYWFKNLLIYFMAIFLASTIPAMVHLFNQTDSKQKKYFFFSIGLLLLLLANVVITLVYLYKLNLNGNKDVLLYKYNIAKEIMEIIFVLFVLWEWKCLNFPAVRRIY